MTKPKDISFRERWPTLYRLQESRWLIVGVFSWFVYQGLAWLTGNSWPLTIPILPAENYQEYMANYQSSLVGFKIAGGMFLLLGPWIVRKPMIRFVRHIFNRRTKEEVKAEA